MIPVTSPWPPLSQDNRVKVTKRVVRGRHTRQIDVTCHRSSYVERYTSKRTLGEVHGNVVSRRPFHERNNDRRRSSGSHSNDVQVSRQGFLPKGTWGLPSKGYSGWSYHRVTWSDTRPLSTGIKEVVPSLESRRSSFRFGEGTRKIESATLSSTRNTDIKSVKRLKMIG